MAEAILLVVAGAVVGALAVAGRARLAAMWRWWTASAADRGEVTEEAIEEWFASVGRADPARAKALAERIAALFRRQ